MGGGYGRGLDFGATWGSGKLPLTGIEPETIPGGNFHIGRSLGAKALNYSVEDPERVGPIAFLKARQSDTLKSSLAKASETS